MKVYWAPGKRFSDYHGVALRYPNADKANERIHHQDLAAPAEAEYCQEHKCHHIVIQDGIAQVSNGNL